jgi:DNA-binding transcriptional MerR regulator
LNKAPEAFRTISEVADELDLPQHVLRFWETRFPHVKPMKRGGGRRYYRPEDIDLLRGIRHLLYRDGYTIRGVQRIFREQGVRTVQLVGQGLTAHLPVLPRDAQDADGEPNGGWGALKFPSSMDSDASDKTENDVGELEPDESVSSEFAPQNRPVAEAGSMAMGPVPTAPGATQLRQASLSAAVPRPRGIAAEDLDRLKHALAELEACRRLLDKAREGGR